MYYKWRDAFLEGGKKALESGNKSYGRALETEIEKLQKIIGKQAIEIEVPKNGRAVSEKIDAVKEPKERGVSIKESCNLVGISRSSYYCYVKDYPLKRARAERCLDEELLEEIEAIKSCHPFWGYRRVTAFLKHRLNINVNHKEMYGIMKEHNLTMPQGKRREMCPGSGGSKLRAERPNEYWGIDMTKFMVESVGWVYLVVVLDWYTKKIVGWNLSLRSTSSEWKEALDMALNNQFPDEARRNGLKLVSDNGSQPTSRSFMQDMATLGIEQIFTSYNNPKGNADTERMMRTIKEEVVWINEFSNFQGACAVVSQLD